MAVTSLLDFQQKRGFMKEYYSLLMNTPLFDGIEQNNIGSMLNCLGARTELYQKNDYLLQTGDSPDSVGLLLSGSVLVMQDDFWGNRNIRARITQGQVFAEAFACVMGAVMDVSVVADESSTVMWLNVRRILRTCPTACAHHSRMISNLLADLAVSNLRANEKLTHISKRSTREKLLSYFSAEAQRQGAPEFTVPFNRQQLADYLSVERSAMSAELSKMQRDGLLRVNKNTFSLNEQAQ